MPALKLSSDFEFGGIAYASPEEWFGEKIGEVSPETIRNQQAQERAKAGVFCEQYGGKLFNSYSDLLEAPDLDAVYTPLPPGLHYRWAGKAVERKKHVFVEKPATAKLDDTRALIDAAKRNEVALH